MKLLSKRKFLLASITLLIGLLFSSYANALVPTTTIDLNPSKPDAYFGWYKTLPMITLGSDQPGSTYYQWDSTTGSWTEYSGSFVYTDGLDKKNDGVGAHTLYFYSTSGADIEDYNFFHFYVDSDYLMPAAGGACDGCHGAGSQAIGGDHIKNFENTPHDTALNDDSGDGYPAVEPAGSPTRCNRCHYMSMKMDETGKPITPRFLRVTGANPDDPDGISDPSGAVHTVLGFDNTICFACHTNAAGGGNSAYNGKTLFEQTKHGKNSGFASPKAATRWKDASWGQGTCGNCHNPHGEDGTTDYTRTSAIQTEVSTASITTENKSAASKGSKGAKATSSINTISTASISDYLTQAANMNYLCYGCHDSDDAPEKPASYVYRGKAQYEAIPHGSTTNQYNKWPNANKTGAAVGTGGSDSGECINCHNPHGMEDAANPGNIIAKLTNDKEENLCWAAGGGACHSATTGSVNGINIYSRFTAGVNDRTRHNVTDADQAAAGSKVECTNCHNPHINSPENMNANPDNKSENYTAKYNNSTLYPRATLQPRGEGKDALVFGYGNSNYGNHTELWIGRQWGYTARSLVEFDLGSIPTDAIVLNAILSLPESKSGSGPAMTINLHKNYASWDETAVKLNNAPAYDPAVTASVVSDNSGATREFSVTSLVQDWVSGAAPNYGVTFKAEDESASSLRIFYSSDKQDPSTTNRANRPKLIIQYVSSNPPKTVNTIDFCSRCHDNATPQGVTMASNVRQIFPNFSNASNSGDFHGARVSFGPASGSGLPFADDMQGPYYFGTASIKCTDCHDPHGSKNVYNLRETINGNSGINIPTANVNYTNYTQVQKLCKSCHTFLHTVSPNCFLCHYHGANADRESGVPGKQDAYF